MAPLRAFCRFLQTSMAKSQEPDDILDPYKYFDPTIDRLWDLDEVDKHALIMDSAPPLPDVQYRTSPTDNLDLTPIQKFYRGTNIFITGSTGFLGKILIDKLLRSCPDISALYLLVRPKKGKSMHTRIDEIFDDVIFERMKKECPKFRHKIVGITGDCSLENLGLTLEDRKELIEKVNIIFHVAATVRFDEKLKTAVAINIRSPRDMAALAHQMTGLKSFVHVSTAFANCPNKHIEEKIYPAAVDYKQMIALAENLSEQLMDEITPRILEKYPNTYAFTKQIAEETVKECAKGLPLSIFRPSIVVSTYKEPIKAWINNMYGPTGVATGAGVGLFRVLHCDELMIANIVPVDMCVNSMIASAWDAAELHDEAMKTGLEFEPPVYNFESSNDNPINWRKFMQMSHKFGMNYPCNKAVWYYTFRNVKNYYLFLVYAFFLHTIPALVVDAALLCIGKQPRMLQVYSKVHKFAAVISYFATQTWRFDSRNVQRVCQKMSDVDKDIFFSDLKKLDWTEFFKEYMLGVRVYLVRDPISSLEEAKVRFNRFYWAHMTVKIVVTFLLLRMFWSLASMFF